MALEAELRDVLVDGLKDYVNLWRLKKLTAPGSEVREGVLEVATRMLDSGWFVVGTLGYDGRFNPWSERGSAAIDRIRREWSATDEPEKLAMVTWFILTESGVQVARQLAD